MAFLLTFRTYGTWLHGDERGAVDREHNVYATEFLRRDERRGQWERSQMLAPAFILDNAMRATVEAAIKDECRYKKWDLLACQVRTNHVHLVVRYAGLTPELMIKRFKARATRWLREKRNLPDEQPIWADGVGGRRYLWRNAQLTAAIAYVELGQDDRHW